MCVCMIHSKPYPHNRVEDVINTDVMSCSVTWSGTRRGEKRVKFWLATCVQGFDLQQVRSHLHELIEETVYCPFRRLLHGQPQTEGRHREEVRVLDLKFQIEVAVRKGWKKCK